MAPAPVTIPTEDLQVLGDNIASTLADVVGTGMTNLSREVRVQLKESKVELNAMKKAMESMAKEHVTMNARCQCATEVPAQGHVHVVRNSLSLLCRSKRSFNILHGIVLVD